MAGKAIAAVGVVLGFVCIWVDSLPGQSYWSGDGTIGAFCLVLACLAALSFATGYARRRNGPLFALGAVMLGFYAVVPSILAFSDWDQLRAGAWLGLAAGALVVIGAGSSYFAEPADTTPARPSSGSLSAAAGIALVFPGIFMDVSGGASYWSTSGHSLGVVLLVLAIAAGLAWLATFAGVETHGLDQAVTLVLLGLVAFFPVGAAWRDFGNLDTGAWLALAGGILAAGGIWAARGVTTPRTAAASA
jgi:hypothetical protein